MHTEQKVWNNLSLMQQNYLNYPTFTEYFVITWLFSTRVLLWGPFLWGPLFGRTCWTCLNSPLSTDVFHACSAWLIAIAAAQSVSGGDGPYLAWFKTASGENLRTKVPILSSSIATVDTARDPGVVLDSHISPCRRMSAPCVLPAPATSSRTIVVSNLMHFVTAQHRCDLCDYRWLGGCWL